MLRSILAVLAGYVAMTLATMIGIVILAWAFGHPLNSTATQSAPSTPYVLCNLVLSLAGAVLGGWTTARIASRSPVRHALALGAVVLVLGVAYAAKDWGGVQPGWYLVVLPLLGGSGIVAGGVFGAARKP